MLILRNILMFVLTLAISCNGYCDVIEEQTMAYQRAVEHLVTLDQFLSRAESQATAAQGIHDLNGFDYEGVREELAALRKRLSPWLIPNDRRLRNHRLVPDTKLFNPVKPSKSQQQEYQHVQ
jgi:hypothetical protein